MLRHWRLLGFGAVAMLGLKIDHMLRLRFGRRWCRWRCRMSLRCRMLIEQCATELHELRAATRAAALQGDLSGGMDQRRVCQMMLIGTQPRAFGGQRAGKMKGDVLL